MILKLKNTPLFLGRGILVTVVVSLFAAYAADGPNADDPNQDNQVTRRSISGEDSSSEDSDDEENDHKNSIATRIWEKIPTIPTSWKRQAFYGGMAACTATFVIYDISRFFDLPSCPESMSTDLVREITRGSIGGGTPIIYFDGSVGRGMDLLYTTLPPELEGLSIVGSRKVFVWRNSNSSYFNLTQEEYRPAEFRPHAMPPRFICSYTLPGNDGEAAETSRLTIYRAMLNTLTGGIVSYLWPNNNWYLA
jgi:hypothetical protein